MIVEKNELSKLRLETEDATIALRFGCYDILHSGHQDGIDRAALQADILVIGVMPDEYMRKVKGPGRPINGEGARAAAIDAATGVDYSFVAPSGALGIARALHALRPDVYIEDSEHQGRMLKPAFLHLLGVEYVIDEWEHTGSSSSIIAQLGIEAARVKSSLSFNLAEEY